MNSICIDIEEGFIQKLAIILHQDNLKNRMNSSFSPYHPGAINFFPCHPGAIDHFLNIFLVQNSLRGKELNKFCPPNSNDDLCLLFCINPSSMCMCSAHKYRSTPAIFLYIADRSSKTLNILWYMGVQFRVGWF